MIEALTQIEALVFRSSGLSIENVRKDKECLDYCGYNFQIGSQSIKFRKAKLTPKKTGQFVTLWKRNLQGQTVPFDLDDNFDLFIIFTEHTHQSGIFIFPKEILAKMGVLTSSTGEGKRGFRLYPKWDVPVSRQGLATKKWQMEHFIDTSPGEQTLEQLQRIFAPVHTQV